MDDVIGLKITDANRGVQGIICWGRLFHPVDDAQFLAWLMPAMPQLGFDAVEAVTVCGSLQELRDAAYFYEGMLRYAAGLAEHAGKMGKLRRKLERDRDRFLKTCYRVGTIPQP